MSCRSSLSSFDEPDLEPLPALLSSIAAEGHADRDLTEAANDDSKLNEDDNNIAVLQPSDADNLSCSNANEDGTKLVPLDRRHSEFYFTADALVNFLVSANHLGIPA